VLNGFKSVTSVDVEHMTIRNCMINEMNAGNLISDVEIINSKLSHFASDVKGSLSRVILSNDYETDAGTTSISITGDLRDCTVFKADDMVVEGSVKSSYVKDEDLYCKLDVSNSIDDSKIVSSSVSFTNMNRSEVQSSLCFGENAKNSIFKKNELCHIRSLEDSFLYQSNFNSAISVRNKYVSNRKNKYNLGRTPDEYKFYGYYSNNVSLRLIFNFLFKKGNFYIARYDSLEVKDLMNAIETNLENQDMWSPLKINSGSIDFNEEDIISFKCVEGAPSVYESTTYLMFKLFLLVKVHASNENSSVKIRNQLYRINIDVSKALNESNYKKYYNVKTFSIEKLDGYVNINEFPIVSPIDFYTNSNVTYHSFTVDYEEIPRIFNFI